MLIEFSVRNFGPFKDVAAMSLVPGTPDEHPGNVLDSEASEQGVLGSAFVYGPNGSGKTSLLDGLRIIKFVLSGGVPPGSLANPCVLGSGGPSEFSVTVAGRYFPYTYSVEVSGRGIESESLYQYATGRRSMVFVRSGNEFRFGKGAVRGHGTPSISSTDAYLPVAAGMGDPSCSETLAEIGRILICGEDSARKIGIWDSDSELKTIVLRALRICDTGIVDISDSSVTHECGGRTFSIPAGSESESVKALLRLIPSVCEALVMGKTIVINNMSCLHPRIVRWIIEQFSSDRNPNSAQLIASLYDTSAMDLKNLLRRDQVYVLDRGTGGASRLARVTDIGGIRKDADLQKSYFGWKLGGLPKISSSEQLLRR